jgi:hypothetical protein
VKRRVALIALLVALVAATAARGGSTRINQGDATAIFNAFGNGGFAGLNHSPVPLGSPADNLGSNGAIRPFVLWEGVHVCALDWHVIVVADFVSGPLNEVAAYFDTVKLDFELDGASLLTTRTPTKRFLREAGVETYAFQQGRIMSPDDLAIGTHHLAVTVTEPGFPPETLSIDFFVDAGGTGACL